MHAYAIELSKELGLKPEQVDRTLALSEEGATVPFIARYRKEATGGLDEVQIQTILDRASERAELDSRRETILRTIEGQGKLTPELTQAIQRAKTRTELEDLYLPYKPKRRTRAAIARERGLEPLAELLWKQESGKKEDVAARARAFVNLENLLDVRQTRHDPLVLPARSRTGRWTTDVWAPLEGRVINAGARIDL